MFINGIFDIVAPANLATFAGIWFAAAASPGGNTAFTISVSSRYGFTAGLIGALGFVTALFTYMMLVSYGLGFALAQYAPIFNILRWLGVAYLLYLACKMWTASASRPQEQKFESTSRLKIYLQGALICFTNPKAIVFIAFIFPQTVNVAQPLAPQLVVLGITGAALSFLVHSAYSTIGHMLGQSVPSPAAKRIVNRSIAAVFCIAAIGLGLANI